VCALEEQGRPREAIDALAATLRDRAAAHGAGLDAPIGHMLRSREGALVPLLQAALGASYWRRFLIAWGVPADMHLDDPYVQRAIVGGLLGLPEQLARSMPVDQRVTIIHLLIDRGVAAWSLGQHSAARADLERAIALGAALGRPAGLTAAAAQELSDRLATAHLHLATIAARTGDLAAVTAHARLAVQAARFPEDMIDRIVTFPDLAARLSPDWATAP
jgi:hypothetical protein